MSNMEGLVVFRNSMNGTRGLCTAEDQQAPDCSIDYLRSREMAERAAAKRAQSLAARHVHQELAQHYAELVRRGG